MIHPRNMGVGTRLALGFGLVVLLLIVVLGVGLSNASSRRAAISRIVTADRTTRRVLEMKTLAVNLNGVQSAYALEIVGGFPNATEDRIGRRKEFLADAAALRTAIKTFAGSPLTASERARVKDLEANFERFMTLDDKVIALFRVGDATSARAATQRVLAESAGIQHDMVATLDQAASATAKIVVANEHDASAAADQARIIMLVIGAIAFALGVALAIRLPRDLIGPLKEAADVLRATADGDLTNRVEAAGRDEVGQMGEALNHTLDQMSVALTGIADGSTTLSASSEELSTVSQQLSSTAEETSIQAASVSAAAEQVSQNVQSVSAGAEELGASIKEISKNTSDAARVAAEAVVVAEATNQKVVKLGASAAEIGEVIKVITQIAGATNLLALNATIEAARAGEAGKGFAVVASEVKDLARQTAISSDEIGRKIGNIQADTEDAVAAIGQITTVIHEISDIQTVIAAAVEEQAATTSEIGRSVTEAAVGSTEIANSITGVAETAQGATQGAAETHRSAEQLARLASELMGLVGHFRIRDHAAIVTPATDEANRTGDENKTVTSWGANGNRDGSADERADQRAVTVRVGQHS